jgi:hypothetical protein
MKKIKNMNHNHGGDDELLMLGKNSLLLALDQTLALWNKMNNLSDDAAAPFPSSSMTHSTLPLTSKLTQG